MAYQPVWAEMFEAEAARLRELLGSAVGRIEHIGSTAVPGMDAKPIIDLMASVEGMATASTLIPMLEWL